jgi:hypothetical protein
METVSVKKIIIHNFQTEDVEHVLVDLVPQLVVQLDCGNAFLTTKVLRAPKILNATVATANLVAVEHLGNSLGLCNVIRMGKQQHAKPIIIDTIRHFRR